jgi:hypothetical protein
MRKAFTLAFLTILIASGVRAQTVVTGGVGLSPVPFWPQNGYTSQLPKGQYVFYDPHSAEYVVYYAPEAAGGSYAEPTVLRFGTHSLVDPEVVFAVAPTGDGRFHYTYKVKNGAHARQSIGRISILDYSDSSPQGAGAKWTAHVEPHNERDLGTPAVSASAIEWQPNSAAPSIAPGSAMQALTIDSTSLPGFVNMAFRGDSKGNEYTPDAVASLPKAVRDQLASVMTAAFDAKSAMVIGPRFAKGTSQSTLSQNFNFGIQVFVRHKLLDPNSTFVQNARRVLSSQLQSNDEIQLNSASLDFTKDAKTDLEKEIANALETIFAQ